MLKEFETGKMYRVKTRDELLNTEGITAKEITVEEGSIRHKDFKEAFIFKTSKESDIKHDMSELCNMEFVAENQKKNTLQGWYVEPWMCVRTDGKGFELPEGLEYKFNSNMTLRFVDLIIDGVVKYPGVMCNILNETCLQLNLSIDTENSCIITFDIMQFVTGKITVRDHESKMIISPYKIVPTDIKLDDIVLCKIKGNKVIGKVIEINGLIQGVLVIRILDAPVESGFKDEVFYLKIENFENGNIKKLKWE